MTKGRSTSVPFPMQIPSASLEISRVQSGGSKLGGLGYLENRDPIKYVDVYRERPIRLTVRVLVPVREHPKFNFVGKLLGPKGNSMKRLQEETMTKMAVLGRGSMRDKQKEEELRASNDPKYQHLHEELHVEITAFAPPAEAHARVAYALTEVRKYLIPDSNDEIRQEQMREMEILAANGADHLSIAAAMAAAAAASDPLKRAAVLSAAAAAGLRSAGLSCGAGQATYPGSLHPSLGAGTTNQAIRSALPNGMRVPTISASPYLTTGAPLMRTAPQTATVAHQKLYTEEMMLEAVAASQAPLDLKESVISSLANGTTCTTSSLLHPSNTSTMDAWQQQQQQHLKAASSAAMDRSKMRQQASPYIRPI
eukprot:snap_masked-scaffold530_size145801-processed-gene-0.5 protein:Tk01197 transcript:snap_masked-scaffold530_size145801-processed-gene-0.5-mRNA-1 annotation:"quaking related isoform x1"